MEKNSWCEVTWYHKMTPLTQKKEHQNARDGAGVLTNATESYSIADFKLT